MSMDFHTAGGDDYYESMRREYSAHPHKSPIPPHLSDEELDEWIQELESYKEERKRRADDKKAGKGPFARGSKKPKLKKRRKR
tara:strand:- start:699 stop:947 length:249 start_codon:yes stop_codon:yes gene_type:complete